MGTATVTFVVAMGKNGPWLTVDRQWTRDATRAIRFELRRTLTMRDNVVFETRCHEIVGLKAWLDMTQAEAELTQGRTQAYLEQLWPSKDGESTRPDPKTDAEERAQFEALEKLWDKDKSNEALALREIRRVIDSFKFLAAWPLLVVKPPPDPIIAELEAAASAQDRDLNPEERERVRAAQAAHPWNHGWQEITGTDDPSGHLLDRLRLAYKEALEAEEETAGNG